MADGVDIDLYADDLDQGFAIKVSVGQSLALRRDGRSKEGSGARAWDEMMPCRVDVCLRMCFWCVSVVNIDCAKHPPSLLCFPCRCLRGEQL